MSDKDSYAHAGPTATSSAPARPLSKISSIRRLLVLPMLCCVSAWSQQQPAPDTTRLEVRSQLVVLDAVVTDRQGNIVRGLTKDDFSVYENGVKQSIRNFSSAAEHPPIPARPVKDRNGNDDWGASPLTMIVVDEMDTPFAEIAYSRDCVRQFLKTQPQQLPTPTILLWLTDDGLRPLTSFTRDRDTILSALRKQPPSLASRLVRGAVAEQVAASFAALQQAALFSRGESGRKQIIWIGRSFPSIDPIALTDYDRTLLTKAVRSTTDLLLSSRVTLYVVDPTVTGSARDDDAQQDVDTLQLVPAGNAKDPFASSFNINLFVAETGGKYFRGRNDLEQQIASSESRSLSYYTLTYVPTTPIEPGAYRKIDVRLDKPGLIVQTKKGYYDESSPATPSKLDASLDENQLRFDLYEAAINRMQYTGVGLHVENCTREPHNPVSTCLIQVDTGPLTFVASDSGEEHTTVLAVLASLNARGKLVNDTISRLTIAIPAGQAAQINHGYSHIRLRTVVPADAASLRVILRDSSGRIGTANVPQDLLGKLAIPRDEAK